MITSKTAQTADTANWIHGCFMVRVGTDFNTYKEMMEYALSDEINGTNAKPDLDPNVKKILNNIGDDGALPVYFSKRKCRDTSLGGNDAINPLPQFGLDDDISHPHYYSEFVDGVQMGQVYSENYDDTQQILYLGFGIPVFSNVGSFWAGAVDLDMANLANKGSGITPEKIGYLIGSAPIRLIKIATIPFKFLAYMTNSLEQIPITKYYEFSSNMPMYFRFVNTILVMLATNMNLMGSNESLGATGSKTSGTTNLGLLNEGTNGTQDLSGMPTVFKTLGLDMARIMVKRYLYENGDGSIAKRWTDDGLFQSSGVDSGTGVADTANSQNPNQSTNPTANGTNSNSATDSTPNSRKWTLGWFDSFRSAYKDAIYDGHLFIGFRIDKGMGASESFSNSTGESQISQTINAKFQEATNLSYAAMGGNIGESGLGGTLTSVLEGVGGFLKGALGTLKLDPLAAALSGSVRVDIPEVWMGSGYSRSASFSITCLAPYGDLETIFQSEYVPLACILAGALPRGTGFSSHASPFICQAYCRGVFSSPLAMIESLEITRGADQFGFTASRLPLKLSMHVTLKDLTPTMYMNMGGNGSIVQDILGADDNFGEYMLTLAGVGLRDRLAPFKTIRRKTQILLSTIYKNKLSPFMLGMEGGSRFMVSRLISTIVSGGRGLPGN